jgi:hypothetical protein
VCQDPGRGPNNVNARSARNEELRRTEFDLQGQLFLYGSGYPTEPQDCGYGGPSALALAVEAVEAPHVSSSTVTSGLA